MSLTLTADRIQPGRVAAEELANALTHGLGVVLGLSGTAALLHSSLQHGVTIHTLAVVLYGGSLVAVFAASTLYHSVAAPHWKAVFGRIDRSCIFTLIAGTYTPFAVTALSGTSRAALLAVIWGVCTLGTVCAGAGGFERFRSPSFPVSLYVLAALPAAVVVHLVHPLPSLLGARGAALVVGGGACYALGIAFYVRRTTYAHTVWHLCVLAGSGLHYFGVLLYAMPR